MPKKSAKKATKKAVAKKAVKKTSIKKAVTRAGRPKGSGKYGCSTTVIRVPTHLVDEIEAFALKKLKADAKK